MPPLIFWKGSGGATYGTTDLATIEDRIDEFTPSWILYVVDERQHLHFQQVFRAAELSGMTETVTLEHVGFGTMQGKDGKPFKTREGGVMQLGVLISRATSEASSRLDEAGRTFDSDAERLKIADQVGIAAIKFSDLRNHRTADYVFDLASFVQLEGRTGPYAQYAAVRAASLLRKAKQLGLEKGPVLSPKSEAERNLVLHCLLLPDAVSEAYKKRTPNVLCDFVYDLAKQFSRFYHDEPVLKEADTARAASLLSIVGIVERQLELVLGLLGITVPERM